MRMLSGRMHWLMVGLALLVSAQGLTNTSHGQMPGAMPGGVMPAGGMMNADASMSMSFPGPAPGEVTYASGCSSCDAAASGGCGGSSCGDASCGRSGLLGRMAGGRMMGGGGCGACGGMGCGACGGAAMGGMGCGACGGGGCGACAGGMGGGMRGGLRSGLGGATLLPGTMAALGGRLAPYSDGNESSRWLDFYAGTIGFRRTGKLGGFQGSRRDPITGQFDRTTAVSSNGIGGPVVLSTTDLDIDRMRWGMELMAAIQTGPGAGVEARYFGLNNWQDTVTRDLSGTGPVLFSAFSQLGTQPNGGFDDTDSSFIHSLSYNSEIHNGEVNYRRRFQTGRPWLQWSWLAGLRYFDLDESMKFSAVGELNNGAGFNFNNLRFSEFDVNTRNQLTGFQTGGDVWINIMPGVKFGMEGKSGIYGNHHEVEHQIVANSIARSGEFLQAGKTAFLTEFTASLLYRLNQNWSMKAGYNLMYVDNVALAPENLNTRGISSVIGGGAFGGDRFPTIDVDSEVFYQGFSFGGEWLY